MKDHKIKIHLIDDIIPGYETNSSKYQISQYDRHSNALANQKIADYITKNILKNK